MTGYTKICSRKNYERIPENVENFIYGKFFTRRNHDLLLFL